MQTCKIHHIIFKLPTSKIMKFIIVFTAIIAMAFSQDTCSHCKTNMVPLIDYLQTDAEVMAATTLMKDVYCADTDDVEGCVAAVEQYFPEMMKTLLTNENTIPGICTGIGACPAKAYTM